VAISDGEMRALARLARLELSEAEMAAQHRHINALMRQFDVLRGLDLAGVPPTSQSIPLAAALRDDEPAESLGRDAVLANAPDITDGCFAVPRILEG